ncbi:MAG: hypothetical protein AAF559_12135 [Pseudomonadota bacterium]
MGRTNLRASLKKRYCHLLGRKDDLQIRIDRTKRDLSKLPDMEKELLKLEALIAAAVALLKDNDPDWDPSQAQGIRPWTHCIPIPFGQCGRRGMKVLRQAKRSMTVRQIAREVLSECGVEDPEAEVLNRVQNAIGTSFRHFRGKFTESSGQYPAQWRAINKPEITFDP